MVGYLLLCLLSLMRCTDPCVYSQAYWLSSPVSRWPQRYLSGRLCDTPWVEIAGVQPIKMALPENRAWVVAAHQVLAALMNSDALLSVNESVDLMGNGVNGASLLLFEGLSAVCDRVGTWGATDRFYNATLLLLLFNTGALDGLPLCTTAFANLTLSSAFYFYNAPDLIINVSQNGSSYSGTVLFSLLEGEYTVQAFLLVACMVAYLIVIPILLSVALCTSSRNRSWHCCQPIRFVWWERQAKSVSLDEVRLKDELEHID
jgi:hypothetical protein